ncbi:MAG: selenocysteine-specific translation elongation factor [Chloroflexota bacterium]
MRVIGTAGHVDHGKSTLIQALTGIDPDRLQEEKERGMTIDLGFAWLSLPSGESVGVVDVPGHIDFIKNMLAGVGGIDAALLVVAADEGAMPQTREHLAILDLLDVSVGIVAVTKADLAEDEDWLELVQADIAELIDGTALSDAEIIPVSATEGQGIPELISALDDLLQKTPPRANKGRPRLLIDRIFSVSGFGTVVTGTLLDGSFMIGQEVELLPSGLRTRIRGLQSHKKKVEEAEPGSRVAINLMNISIDQVKRGDIVTTPDWLEPSQLIDTRLRCLADMPRPLKHNQEVEIFTGSTEVVGNLRLLGTREIRPGEDGWVQLRLQRRIPIVKGDHFIVRQASPSLTIGGGIVVDPLPRRRHRRFRPELIKRLERMADGTPEELLVDTLDRLGPMQVREFIKHSPLSESVTDTALHALFKTDYVFQIPRVDDIKPITNLQSSKTVIASKVGWSNVIGQMKGALSQFHQTYPLRVGMPRGELKSRLKLETGLFNRIIEQAQRDSIVEAVESTVWLDDHTPQFTPDQQQAMDRLLTKFEQNPFATPSFKESLPLLNNDEDVLMALIETGKLLRLSADVLLLPSTYGEFAAWVRTFVTENGSVTVAQVRDAYSTSRKYALALLEYTDSQGITRRVGDERLLR